MSRTPQEWTAYHVGALHLLAAVDTSIQNAPLEDVVRHNIHGLLLAFGDVIINSAEVQGVDDLEQESMMNFASILSAVDIMPEVRQRHPDFVQDNDSHSYDPEQLSPGAMAQADQVHAEVRAMFLDLMGHYCEFRAATEGHRHSHPFAVDTSLGEWVNDVSEGQAKMTLLVAMNVAYENSSQEVRDGWIRSHQSKHPHDTLHLEEDDDQ